MLCRRGADEDQCGERRDEGHQEDRSLDLVEAPEPFAERQDRQER